MAEPFPSPALVLAIDTSTRHGTIALLRATAAQPSATSPLETIEVAALTGGQPSETLVPAIAALLARHAIAKRSLSLLVVASGPGSFTGLRVSLATVKGLAEALAIPVVPVSVLEAIALAASAGFGPSSASAAEGRVVSVLDAQRDEVYFGEFCIEHGSGLAQTLREEIAPFSAFARRLSCCASAGGQAQAGGESIAAALLVTPDEALGARLREAVACAGGGPAAHELTILPRPTAEQIARIGWRKFAAGLRADAATLDANYLRRSEAELISAPRLGIPPR